MRTQRQIDQDWKRHYTTQAMEWMHQYYVCQTTIWKKFALNMARLNMEYATKYHKKLQEYS